MKIIFTSLVFILVIVLLFLFYILMYRDMLFRDRKIYFYTEKYPKIYLPKIIHQTWKTKNLDEKQRKWQKTILDKYPDYTYILWDDEDIENFARKYFPWYMDTWNNLTPFIKKVDTIRYMWMYYIGGIYFDLDIIANKNMEKLLDFPNSAYIPVSHSKLNWEYDKDMASPAILASCPGNKIWLDMLEQIKNNINRPVLKCTGPVGLSNLLLEIHKRQDNEKPNLILLSEARLGLGPFKISKYSNHINTGTWTK